jgi:hypothetical protein
MKINIDCLLKMNLKLKYENTRTKNLSPSLQYLKASHPCFSALPLYPRPALSPPWEGGGRGKGVGLHSAQGEGGLGHTGWEEAAL